jgi:hypothetical protein
MLFPEHFLPHNKYFEKILKFKDNKDLGIFDACIN